MKIRLLKSPVSLSEVAAWAKDEYGDMIKACVDVEREVIAIGGALHADEETVLLDDGSRQEHVWGINLYPSKEADEKVQFDSMINLRPSQGNRSRGVDDPVIRDRILRIVRKLVQA